MVKATYLGSGGEAKGSEIIVILAFIVGLVIVFYYLAKKEIGSLGSGLSAGIKDAFDFRTPDQKAEARYEIATSGTNIGAPIVSVAPSPTILAAMQRYYDTGDVKTYTNAFNQVWAIDAPSIDPAPISTETPSGYIVKNGVKYWVYGCDGSGNNCTSFKPFGFWDTTIGYRDLT